MSPSVLDWYGERATLSPISGRCSTSSGSQTSIDFRGRVWKRSERILEGGALGVIVPHIWKVQDAKDVVMAAKFQPQGCRSSTNGLPHFQYCSLPAKVANPIVNASTLAIPMIGTLEALEIVDEVAAVDGVDSLLIGTNDLTADLGVPGDYENPRPTQAYERTIAACKKANKRLGIGGLHARLDLVEKFSAMGANWVMAATDAPLMVSAATEKAREMDALNEVISESRRSKLNGLRKKPDGINVVQ